jgi:hypothetical protein
MNRSRTLAMASTLGALVAAVAAPAGTANAAAGHWLVVHRGESIQHALDSVADDGTVLVEPGTYAENLTVTRPVTLEGLGAVRLVPPAQLDENPCTTDPDAVEAGTNQTGICVVGDVSADDPPVVHSRLAGVAIRGLTVSGFRGIGVEAYATSELRVDHVVSEHNAGGGFFAAASPGARLTHVTARDNGAQGVNLHWADDGAALRDSSVSGNHGEGVFVGDSAHVAVTGNRVGGNCAGIVAIDLNLTGTGLSDALVSGNQVAANNLFCPGAEGAPSESGTGIALAGAVDSVVSHNRVLDNAASQDAFLAFGGIALLDADQFTGGAIATGNTVTDNVARGNRPADLLNLSTGTNVWRHNACATSIDGEGADLCQR